MVFHNLCIMVPTYFKLHSSHIICLKYFSRDWDWDWVGWCRSVLLSLHCLWIQNGLQVIWFGVFKRRRWHLSNTLVSWLRRKIKLCQALALFSSFLPLKTTWLCFDQLSSWRYEDMMHGACYMMHDAWCMMHDACMEPCILSHDHTKNWQHIKIWAQMDQNLLS